LWFSSTAIAQYNITGKIIDAETQEPIYGASIYFDGTTIGTISNQQGNFKLTYEQNTKALLVVSSMGYEAQQFQISTKETHLKTILLKPSIESLDEVFLETDPWSREKKLRYFREWFLGSDYREKKCKILNEEVIQLRFSPTTQKLTAIISESLIIENKYLGYNINYQLKDFDLSFSKSKMLKNKNNQPVYLPQMFYYSGTSFFQELKGKTKKRFKKRRAETYLGSVTHFMRCLAKKELRENDYRIFHKRFETPPYKFFEVEQINKAAKITIKTPKISILYNNKQQSFIQIINDQISTTFYVDELGNFYPATGFSFGGDMGKQRVANLLPLDYKP